MSEVEYKREPTKKQLAAWAVRDAKRRSAVSARFVRLTGINYATQSVYVVHRACKLEKRRTKCGMRMKGAVGVQWFSELPEGTETLCCTHPGCFPDYLKPV